jgi:capsular polysaccharide transport system permease protein
MGQAAARLFSGAHIQARTIHALMIRDLMMRYGRENIGFVWFVLEPIFLAVGIMFVWLLLGFHKGDIKVVELVLTGYLPLTLWRHLTGPITLIFRRSISLFYHRPVTFLDVVLSRLALEFLGTTAALLLFLTGLIVCGAVSTIQSLDYFVLGWMMMAWIGAASGILIACITEVSETSERIIPAIQYINLPISGCFLIVDWLPPWAQKLIMYHPLVHCYEVFRRGYFGEYVPTHYDIPYFAFCAFVLSFMAAVSVEAVRSRVQY